MQLQVYDPSVFWHVALLSHPLLKEHSSISATGEIRKNVRDSNMPKMFLVRGKLQNANPFHLLIHWVQWIDKSFVKFKWANSNKTLMGRLIRSLRPSVSYSAVGHYVFRSIDRSIDHIFNWSVSQSIIQSSIHPYKCARRKNFIV